MGSFSTLVVFLHALSAAQLSLSLDEIRTRVHENMLAIDTFSVEVTTEYFERSAPGEFRPPTVRREVVLHVDPAGRMRDDSKTLQISNNTEQLYLHYLFAFDGKDSSKRVSFDEEGNQVGGRILKDASTRKSMYMSGMSGGEFPAGFGNFLSGSKSLYDILESDDTHLVGEEIIDGTPCIVITSGNRRLALSLDHDLTLKQSELYRDADHQELFNRRTNTEFEENDAGVWLPVAGTTSFGESLGSDTPESTWRVSKLDVNIDFPDELFQIEFADGIAVHDERSGITTQHQGGLTQGSPLDDRKASHIPDTLDEPPKNSDTETAAPPVATLTDSNANGDSTARQRTGRQLVGILIVLLALVAGFTGWRTLRKGRG